MVILKTIINGEYMAYRQTTKTTITFGSALGSALAVTISWSLHKSVLWACIHGIFSWFYVIYYLVQR